MGLGTNQRRCLLRSCLDLVWMCDGRDTGKYRYQGLQETTRELTREQLLLRTIVLLWDPDLSMGPTALLLPPLAMRTYYPMGIIRTRSRSSSDVSCTGCASPCNS